MKTVLKFNYSVTINEDVALMLVKDFQKRVSKMLDEEPAAYGESLLEIKVSGPR